MAKAHAFDFAEQVCSRNLELIKADLVFLHATIADHLDLAARHAFCRERIVIVAAWLFREKHGEAGEIVRGRVRACEHRHQVRTDGVGDPGLVTGDLVGVAILDRAGLQAAEVRAGIRLCEDGCRQDFAG